jgi:hypothetical protein
MFHATSMRLAALATRIRAHGLSRDQQVAAAHGWQAEHIAGSTYRYRDPRFDRLATRPPAPVGGGRHG